MTYMRRTEPRSECLVYSYEIACLFLNAYNFLLLGSALDLNFSDINVASLDKDFEDQDNNGLCLTSKTLSVPFLSLISVTCHQCCDLSLVLP